MNESSESNTSILLPAARVGFYVLDADLREVAKTLSDDWRFARVTFEIHEGDVETAIQAYQGVESPELLKKVLRRDLKCLRGTVQRIHQP